MPIRKGAGSVAAASTSDSANVPKVSRNSALSVTRAARQPWVDRSCQPPELGIVPCVGLNPTSPQQAAGMRIDPAPSEAVAMPTAPAATNAAEPPDEPPLVWARFNGLRVMPFASDSVKPKIASSGSADLATTTMPAARIAATSSVSWFAGSSMARLPLPVTWPAMSRSSLTATGTPSSGPLSPAARRLSASSAAASASSA